MEDRKNLIDIFYVEEIQGKCTDANFEFGNMYRKTFECAFFKNGECHYKGECDRKDIPNQNLGWRNS